MSQRLEIDGYGALVAEPYAQTVVRVREDVIVAASGGGGGAAQLLPADLLGPAIDGAIESAREHPGHERMVRMFSAVDARIAELRAGVIYRGTSASAVAAVRDGELLWLGVAGLGRGYRIERDRSVVVTRDDSLVGDVIDAGVDPTTGFSSYTRVATAILGAWRPRRQGWRPVASPLADALGFVLATEEAWRADPGQFADLARIALAAPSLAGAARAMWNELRPGAASSPAFDRSAALILVRPC